jgi:aspartate aminotransferase-like enzyme
MKTYPIPMIPGPVSAHPAVLAAYRTNYGSADLENEFVELYLETEAGLQELMQTRNRVVIQSGEGMLALWSALKSCLRPGDPVLAVATGVFGHGIADMARSIGAEVHKISLAYDQTISDLSTCQEAIERHKPKMITAVHCETPSGTLNPLAGLGRLKMEHNVPLLYVDAVSSLGGAELKTDPWHIDLCLGGAQKCIAALADTAFLSVSDRAWEMVEQVGYVGYDALQPFRKAAAEGYFPYTPHWHGVAGLNAGVQALLQEGLAASIARHERAAELCREKLAAMGLRLFPAPDARPSPTVTAVYVPQGISWEEFDARLRRRGLAVAGSYGPLAGNVFRIGHMGTQADRDLLHRALAVLSEVLGTL